MRSFPLKEQARRIFRAAKRAFRQRVPRKSPPLALLFDASWYAKGLEKKELPEDLLDHYLKVGYMTGNPNPMFDTVWYVAQHPELKSGDKNPFAYYLETGERSGDLPSPRFDPKWYLKKYPDVAATKASPLAHFLRFGAAEGRLPLRPAHFRSMPEISSFLGALPASLSAKPCSVELPVRSLESLQSSDRVGHVRNIFRAQPGFCEGMNGPPAYPATAYVACIKRAWLIAGTRYLLDPSGVLLHDENANFLKRDDVAIKYEKATRSSLDGFLNIDVGARQAAWIDIGLNIMHEYENNYFHFIAETLPRMMISEEAGIPAEIPYLMSNDLHPNIMKLFELANKAGRSVISLEKGTLYKVEEMYYPSDLTSMIDAYQGGQATRESGLDVGRIRTAVDHCRSFFPPAPEARKRRIFASRSGSYRKLLNQEEIERRVVEIGFEVIDTDGLDLEAQIRLFQDAEIIIGPTGAQMSNMVWCQPGARVLVLASDHPSHQLYFWELLGQVSNAAVTTLQGPLANSRDDIYSLHDDYFVDSNAVIEAASRLI